MGKGNFTFKYTDYWGQIWETDPVSLEPVSGTLAGVGDAAANAAIALRAEEALEKLPNNVLNDVQVKVTECAKVIPGQVTIGNADVGGLTANTFVNFPTHTTTTPLKVNAATFTLANSLSTYTAYPATANPTTYSGGAFTGTANLLSHANCVRFHVYFVSTPGDLVDLAVDTTMVTVTNQ